jgi:aminotransferase
MRKEYKRRREYIVDALNEVGLRTTMPEGAFYCFPSVRKTGMSGMEFATSLLKKNKVAVVPGEAFGDAYKEFVRISYAQPLPVLKEAIDRIKTFISK